MPTTARAEGFAFGEHLDVERTLHPVCCRSESSADVFWMQLIYRVRPEQPVSPDGEAMGVQIRRLHAMGLGDADA